MAGATAIKTHDHCPMFLTLVQITTFPESATVKLVDRGVGR